MSNNLYTLKPEVYHDVWLSSHRVPIARVKARFETISDRSISVSDQVRLFQTSSLKYFAITPISEREKLI